jgi:hypothetical protein
MDGLDAAAAEEAPQEAGAGEAPQEGGAAGGTYRRPVLAPKIKRLMQARRLCACPVCSAARWLTRLLQRLRAQRDEDVGKISQYTPLALGALPHALARAPRVARVVRTR